MKVELAGAAAFACLGLIAGALLRPQPGDFRRDLVEPAGFMGPPAGPVGGADPTGGWGAGGWSGSGPVPENPPCEAQGCLGRLGMESFLEPQVFTHAARVKVEVVQ